jgi:hypothetical protein
MLFPCRFNNFDVRRIGSNPDPTPETLEILQIWKYIEASEIWGLFYLAARDLDYDTLLEIGDCFVMINICSAVVGNYILCAPW